MCAISSSNLNFGRAETTLKEDGCFVILSATFFPRLLRRNYCWHWMSFFGVIPSSSLLFVGSQLQENEKASESTQGSLPNPFIENLESGTLSVQNRNYMFRFSGSFLVSLREHRRAYNPLQVWKHAIKFRWNRFTQRGRFWKVVTLQSWMIAVCISMKQTQNKEQQSDAQPKFQGTTLVEVVVAATLGWSRKFWA